jgi:hypothetical protein
MPEQGFTDFERNKRHKKPILKDPIFYAAVATAVFLKIMSVSPSEKSMLACKPAKAKTESTAPAQFRQSFDNFKKEVFLSFGEQKQAKAVPFRNTNYTP